MTDVSIIGPLGTISKIITEIYGRLYWSISDTITVIYGRYYLYIIDIITEIFGLEHSLLVCLKLSILCTI